MSTPSPRPIDALATYARCVEASLARVWENVLDWEHLPWLHREAFRSIRLLGADATGWRAEVGLHGAPARQVEIEVRTERESGRYVTRTLAGPGAGTEIWTELEPQAPRRTGVHVSFHVPGMTRREGAPLGEAFVALYRRLWDQDEAMMRRRQAVLDRGRSGHPRETPPTPLGPLGALRERLPLVVEHGPRRYRVVAIGDQLVAHAVACPHWGGPLEEAPLEDGCITCPWHGYRFDLRRGESADGRGLRLPRASLRIDPATHQVSLVSGGSGPGAARS